MDWRKLERDLIDIRRDLHRYPEAAWTEFRTSSLIAERLERLGCKPRVGLDTVETSAVMGRPSEEESSLLSYDVLRTVLVYANIFIGNGSHNRYDSRLFGVSRRII